MLDDPSTLSNDVSNGAALVPRARGGSGDVVSTVGGNVRRLRERTGLSLRELASRAAVSVSTLSNIEAGLGNPAVETLVHIGGALGVPFSELVMPYEPDVRVQWADQGVVVEATAASFRSRLLVADAGRSVTEVYEGSLEPGEVYRAEPHLPGLSESVIVLQGAIRVGPEDAPVELRPGDRATFAGDRPHTYEALAATTRIIMVLSYR